MLEITDFRKEKHGRPLRHLPAATPMAGAHVSREEIEDIIVDPGYSADQRKGWLKQVLADLTRQQSGSPSSEQEQLIEMVKQAIDDQQDGKPIATDLPGTGGA